MAEGGNQLTALDDQQPSSTLANQASQIEKQNFSVRVKKKKNHKKHNTQIQVNASINQICTSTGNIHFGDVVCDKYNESVVQNVHDNPPTDQSHRDTTTMQLQSKLRKLYKQSTLPRVVWMEEGCDLPLKDYYATLQLESTGDEIKLNQLFEEKESEPKNRILIEAQPGFGKTTLATKLAYDWASNEEYLERFELVFVMRLKEISGHTLPEGLESLGRLCGFRDKEELKNAIEVNGEKVLIILDGFDELSKGETRTNILRVLYQQEYSDATVVLTCRTGLFNPENEEFKQFSTLFSRKREFYDKKVTILGVDEIESNQLMRKFLETDVDQKNVEKFFDSKELCELFTSPLVVMMLAFLYSKGEILTEHVQVTKAKFFKNLLNGIVKVNLTRMGQQVPQSLDCFSIHQPPSAEAANLLRDKLIQFGRFCLEMDAESKFQLDEDKLTREMYNLGFLTKIESKKMFRKETHYEVFHRSFLKFFAAYYIYAEILNESDLILDAGIQNYFYSVFTDNSTSLVPSFLIGLLGTEAHFLLDILINFAFEYSYRCRFWEMFEDCPYTDQIIERLIHFLPSHSDFLRDRYFMKSWKNLNYTAEFRNNLLTKGFNGGKLHHVYLSCLNEIQLFLSLNVHCESVTVVMGNDLLSDNGLAKLSQQYLNDISCSELKLLLNTSLSISEYKLKLCLELLRQFANKPVDRRRLFFDGSAIFLLEKCIDDDPFHQSIIHTLQLDIWHHSNVESDWVGPLVELIKRDRLQELIIESAIWLPNGKTVEICKSACESHSLTALSVTYRYQDTEEEWDLHVLTNGGMKSWDSLRFEEVKVTCNIPLTTVCHIKYLVLLSVEVTKNAVGAILNCHVTTLECKVPVINEILKSSKSFDEAIFTSVVELIILCDPQGELMRRNLKSFKNVEKLSIVNYFLTNVKLTMPETESVLFDVLQLDRLTQLAIDGAILSTDVVCQILMSPSASNQNYQKHSLKSIDILLNELDYEENTFHLLFELIEKQIVKSIGIIASYSDPTDIGGRLLRMLIENNCKIRIERTTAGERLSDMKRWKRTLMRDVEYVKWCLHSA